MQQLLCTTPTHTYVPLSRERESVVVLRWSILKAQHHGSTTAPHTHVGYIHEPVSRVTSSSGIRVGAGRTWSREQQKK